MAEIKQIETPKYSVLLSQSELDYIAEVLGETTGEWKDVKEEHLLYLAFDKFATED